MYSWSRSAVPGNLVCYRGRVISQGLDGLEVYYQANAARDEVTHRLAANPDDIEGLTLRGEMFLDAGKSTEAVADFRRAYSLDKNSDSHVHTRELLRDALLSGLRDDFAAHRSTAGEVEPLLDNPAQRASYYRCMATGLHHAGDWRQAVEYYMKLVDLEEAKPAKTALDKLERVDRSYLARRDCWVRARLALLRKEGGAAAAAEIDRALELRLEEVKMDTGFDRLKQFIAFFGDQPQAVAARAELLQRLTQQKQIMQAELLMAASVDSSDRKAQAALLAEMAELNFGAGRVGDAAACFRQLQRQFPDVPCHEGLTSGQWLAAFPNGDALRREVNLPAPAWPVGEVETGPAETNDNPFVRGFRFDMLLGGVSPFWGSGPFFTDYTVSSGNGLQEVCLRDGTGHLQDPIRLIENGRMFGGMYNPNSTLARSCGHLLVASIGMKICALDPWRVSGNTAQVLWSKDLSDTTTENFGNMIFVNNGINPDFRVNPFGPVNARYVSFVRRRSIVAVDPFSGDELWVRQDIPPKSEVFGDAQYLFVLAPGSDEASVYRASDGQLLGTRKVPRRKDENVFYNESQHGGSSTLANFGFAFQGRYVLTWEQGGDNNGRVLTLFDPWLQKAVWPGATSLPARMWPWPAARRWESWSRADISSWCPWPTATRLPMCNWSGGRNSP